jgi:hypothetical protein
MIQTPARAVRVSSVRAMVRMGEWLRPTREQAFLAEKFGYRCHSLAGRPRALHMPDKSGVCIMCGHVNPSADLALGDNRHR